MVRVHALSGCCLNACRLSVRASSDWLHVYGIALQRSLQELQAAGQCWLGLAAADVCYGVTEATVPMVAACMLAPLLHTHRSLPLSFMCPAYLSLQMVEPCCAAGLTLLNLSLDTLQPARFEAMTRRPELEDVITESGLLHQHVADV